MNIRASNIAQIENVKNNCINRVRVDTDLKFMVRRALSYFAARITFIRLDTFDKVTYDFFDKELTGEKSYMMLSFNGKGFSCHNTDSVLCQGLPIFTPVPAIIQTIYIDPINGSGDLDGGMEYSLRGSYQRVTCGKSKNCTLSAY